MREVKICLGRFQPFTLGHLKMATYKDLKGPKNIKLRETPDLKHISQLPTVLLVISNPKNKVDLRHPFDDDLMSKEFDIIKRQYPEIIDVIYVQSANLVAWGETIKQHGYQAAVWLTGTDEFGFYNRMASKVPDYEEHNRNNRNIIGAFTKSFYVEEIKRVENSDDFAESISGTKVREAIKNDDFNSFVKMMPKGTAKLFSQFQMALNNLSSVSEHTSLQESLQCIKSLYTYLFEGGDAIKSAQPIPAVVAPKVYAEVEERVRSKYRDIQMAPLGSIGKKPDDQTNGDIDIAILIPSKEDLNQLVDTCFGDCEINYKTTSSITSIGYKYNIDGYKGVAQVDFMIVKNMTWANTYYHSPNFRNNESKYKGAVRNRFLADIISCIPIKDVKDEYFEDGKTVKRHWKYTFNTEGVFKQLIDFCGKSGQPLKNGKKLKEFEQLILNDPVNLVRFVFGDEGSIEDLNSAESLWVAFHDRKKFKWGNDVIAKIEEKIMQDKDLQPKYDLSDFKCEFYK